MGDKLNKKEILILELNMEKIQNLKLKKEMIDDKKQISDLQIKILELQKQIMIKDSVKYNQKKLNIESELNKLLKSSKENIEDLKKKYKVETKGFGFDPETGEIDREDR